VAPRSYTQRRRAESAEETRRSIVTAAAELYRERGVAATTLAAVAERADVSRGTILNHFGGADGLLDAVADHALEMLELPDERVLDGIAGPEARIRTFVTEMVRFFERSTPWWQVFESQMERPSLQAREAIFWAALGRLRAAALGPEITADARAMATIDALIHPGTLGTFLWVLEQAGVPPKERSDIVGDLVIGYLDRRLTAAPDG
jgi:AcrR family transcriptional regulator